MSNQLPLSLVPEDSSGEEMDILLRADPYECRKLARRTDLSPNIVKKLFPKFPQEMMDSGVLEAMIQTHPQVVHSMFEDYSHIVCELLINEEWAKYFINSNLKIVAAVAANPMLPKIYWDYCVHHYSVDVRRGIAMNPAIGSVFVATLSGDSDPTVQRLAAGQMRSRFPSVPVTEQLPVAQRASSVKLQQMAKPKKNDSKNGIQITINSLHLIIAGLSIALLFCGGMLAMRLLIPSNIVTSTAGIAKVSAIDAEDGNYALAIEHANEASALARTSPEAKGEWEKIITNWDKAIELLEKVDKNQPEYAKARKKIRNYKVIRSVASGYLAKAK